MCVRPQASPWLLVLDKSGRQVDFKAWSENPFADNGLVVELQVASRRHA